MRLFKHKTIGIDSDSRLISIIDGECYYWVKTETSASIHSSRDGLLLTIDEEDISVVIKGLTLCKIIDKELYIVIFTVNKILLYKHGKNIHSIVREGLPLRAGVGSVIKYYVFNRMIIEYSIVNAMISTRFIDISALSHGDRHFELCICRYNEHLYVSYKHLLYKYEYATDTGCIINMSTHLPNCGITFSECGEYTVIYKCVDRRVSAQLINTSSITAALVLPLAQLPSEKLFPGDCIRPTIFRINNVIVIGHRAIVLHNTYNLKNRKIKSISYELDIEYIKFCNRHLCIIRSSAVDIYDFAWNIRHVGQQTPEIQKIVMTTFLCLWHASGKQLLRDLIYMIINLVYEQ